MLLALFFIGLVLLACSHLSTRALILLGAPDVRPTLRRLSSAVLSALGVGCISAASVEAYVRGHDPFIIHSSEVIEQAVPGRICASYLMSKRYACPARLWIYLTPVGYPIGAGALIDYVSYSNIPPGENIEKTYCYTVDNDEAAQVKRGRNRLDIMSEHECRTWFGYGAKRYFTRWFAGAELAVQ